MFILCNPYKCSYCKKLSLRMHSSNVILLNLLCCNRIVLGDLQTKQIHNTNVLYAHPDIYLFQGSIINITQVTQFLHIKKGKKNNMNNKNKQANHTAFRIPQTTGQCPNIFQNCICFFFLLGPYFLKKNNFKYVHLR